MKSSPPVRRAARLWLTAWLLLLISASRLPAQNPDQIPPPAGADDSSADRVWISFQANIIAQEHPPFDARYSGPDSSSTRGEHAASHVETLYTGVRIIRPLEVLCDVENVGGDGLSSTQGVGGFTDVDAIANPLVTGRPYLARLMLHYTIPLASSTV